MDDQARFFGRVSARSVACVATTLLVAAVGYDAMAGTAKPAAAKRVTVSFALSDFARPAAIPMPDDNASTPERVALGEALFFDPRLSGSGAISCASCHNPGLGWQDGMAKGLGHMGGRLHRHTPTILNVAYGEPFFWDGRADTLEAQAKGPLAAPAEMNMPPAAVVDTVAGIAGYRDAFARAYPGKPISMDAIAWAIAAFERTVVSGSAPFDAWVAGNGDALSPAARRGFALFTGKGNCAVCHQGWRFSDDGFHDIGLPDEDRGRAAISAGIPQLEHAFKTPTLRNIRERAPYMHDGSVATLEAVVDHYDTGFQARASLDPQMHRLNLTASEKHDLVAFLDSLSSTDPAVVMPVLPR
ncbi:MAG: Cytochrome peroxidase precursor [Pseudomonadota bacterium]